jgi:hypothetical protein
MATETATKLTLNLSEAQNEQLKFLFAAKSPAQQSKLESIEKLAAKIFASTLESRYNSEVEAIKVRAAKNREAVANSVKNGSVSATSVMAAVLGISEQDAAKLLANRPVIVPPSTAKQVA